MSQIVIEGGQIKDLGGGLVGKLAEFLNSIASLKIEAKVDGSRVIVSPKTIEKKAKKVVAKKKTEGRKKKGEKATITPEITPLSKTKLKIYLKKFLNKQKLSDEVRVISGGEDTFVFYGKPVIEEELPPEEEQK